MTINEHLGRFHGLPIHHVVPALDRDHPLPPGQAAAWRVALEYDDKKSFEERWLQFLDAVDASSVRAVVIGAWWEDHYDSLKKALDAIVRSAGRLPALRALFIGDVTYDECEISWLQMCDVTPVLTAFPLLEELVVRGGTGLKLKPLRHEHLRSLRFEAGGLPAEVVRAVGDSDLPALQQLELWLGVDEYGGDSTVDDLAPFLTGVRFPALRHLALENSAYQDEIAVAVAQAPVVPQLEHIGLAMGVLTDEGAAALLEGQPLTHLATLDLHHHYIGEELQQRLTEALAGVDVDISDAEDEDDEEDRYVAVAE